MDETQESIESRSEKETPQPPVWLARFPKLDRLYHRYERFVGVLVFAFGFIWDSLTMVRIDNPIDIVIITFYLTALGCMIHFTLRRQAGRELPYWAARMEPYFLWAMQFAFGGLFSSYVIFYFKSASWTRTRFFFFFLVCLLIGNELLHHRLQNPKLLATLYSFCLLSFLAFFLPILFASLEPALFVLAGALSVLISAAVFGTGFPRDQGDWDARMKPAVACILAVFIGLNVLYFARLIPPVPLALKSAGIYYGVVRTPVGYEVRYVPTPFYQFWKQVDNPFFYSPGDSVYCFSAIFAPRKFRVPVHHVWSRYTDTEGWHETDKIAFEISGGREGGYRGYTWKRTIAPGRWRVEVETDKGQILGRIDFTVVGSANPPPNLTTRIIP